MKKIIIVGMLILLIPIVMACKESYTNKEDVYIFDVIESDGLGANCNISLYNLSTLISNHSMVRNGLQYSYNFSRNLSPTTYRANIECVGGGLTYLSECSFIVEEEVESEYYLYVVAIILLIVLIVIGYVTQQPIFLILGGMLSSIIAVNLFVNGFPLLTNDFLQNGIIIILAGIGFYYILAPTIEYFENFSGFSGGDEE